MKAPLFALFACAAPLAAADPRGDSPDAPPSTPEEQLAKFHVPPGFEVQLVAAEPEIQKPLSLNFDAAGRLWATGTELYPWPAATDAKGKPIPGFEKTWQEMAEAFRIDETAPKPSRDAKDTLRVLSDFGPDGRARKIVTFADGLNIPTGIQPMPRKPGAKGDTAIVFSIPNIWRMTDTDGDGRADLREPLYEGFGYTDTHGMSSNYLYWIDGWIYGCHGFRNHSEVKDRSGRVTVFDSGNTYRFRPDGSQIEYYTHGQTNPYGLTVDPLGNFFSADSHSKPVMLLIRGGYYAGIGKEHDGLGFAPTITDDDHGSSSIAGVAYYADDKFPEEYRGNLFNGNPVTRRINRDRLEWHGSTPRAIRMPDFLTCDDPWFRPVQVKLGPDGALWIADFYTPIIGHYEVPLTDKRRDHQHGRIWRVVWRGENASTQTPGTAPKLTTLDTTALVEKLADPSLIVRTLATHELVARPEGCATFELLEQLPNSDSLPSLSTEIVTAKFGLPPHAFWNDGVAPSAENGPPMRGTVEERLRAAHALWALERLGELDDSRLAIAIHGDSDSLRQQFALRVLAERKSRAEGVRFALKSALSVAFHSVSQAALEVLANKPLNDPESVWYCFYGFDMADTGSSSIESDPAWVYSAKVAMREQLKARGGYAAAEKETHRSPNYPRFVADVSLAVKSSESAQFLLTHLIQTKIAGARAGEYLHHVAQHLPEEQFGQLAMLTDLAEKSPLPQRFALADALGTAARQRKITLPEDAQLWTERTLLEALNTGKDKLLDDAIDAVRDLKSEAKRDALAKIVVGTKENGLRRAAALEALMNLPGAFGIASFALNDPSSLFLRKKAAELLGEHCDTGVPPVIGRPATGGDARITLLAALPTAPTELALVIAVQLVKSHAGCSQLLDLVEQGKAPAALLRSVFVAHQLAGRDRTLRDRAAALTKDLPPENTRLDKVIAERAKSFRDARPDTVHGAQVFQQNCAVCHRFRNAGGNVGPNLDGVSARGVHRLIEDILDPHRNVDPAFHQTNIETLDGQNFVGANVRDNGDAITLTDATGKDATFPKAAIKSRTPSKFSLMPSVFETQIPPADFHDLVGYLLDNGAQH